MSPRGDRREGVIPRNPTKVTEKGGVMNSISDQLEGRVRKGDGGDAACYSMR